MSPIKFSHRVRKEKVKMPSYKELLKLHVKQMKLVEVDDDEEDQAQRQKVMEKTLQRQKQLAEKMKPQTPRKSALEEQLTRFEVTARVARPKTATITPETKKSKSYFSSVKHVNVCKKQHRPQIFPSTSDCPTLITNAFRKQTRKSLPKGMSGFLSSLRFQSQQLKPLNGLDIDVDEHQAPPRTTTSL